MTKYFAYIKRKIAHVLEGIKLPFLNYISLYKIINIFIKGLRDGALGTKAAATSWNIFMSFFPFTIILFTLFSLLPKSMEISSFVLEYLLQNLLPNNIFTLIKSYIEARTGVVATMFKQYNTLFLVLSILIFIHVSSNGIRSLIKGFRSTSKDIIMLPTKLYLDSVLITIFFSIFIIITLIISYFTKLGFIFIEGGLSDYIEYYRNIINIINIIISIFFYFIGICLLYYLGRTIKLSFKEVIPGALLTTFLFFLMTPIFGYYIAHFTRFNILYGSIGSILIIMLWINLSITLIFIGYELNIAVKKAKTIYNKHHLKPR